MNHCFKRQVAAIKNYIISEVIIKKENSDWCSYYEIKEKTTEKITKKPITISPILKGVLDYTTHLSSKEIFNMVDELKKEKQNEKNEREEYYDL